MAVTPTGIPYVESSDLVANYPAVSESLAEEIESQLATKVGNTIVDAKGDLIAGSAADTFTRVAVGTNGQILIADSTATAGIKWGDLGIWTTYTPTWSSSGTQPALGNGSISGRYAQIGKIVLFSASLVMGSTTTYGSGSYSISIPVNARVADYIPIGQWQAVDVSLGVLYAGLMNTVSNVGRATWYQFNTGGTYATVSTVDLNIPFAVANGDIFKFSGIYEAA